MRPVFCFFILFLFLWGQVQLFLFLPWRIDMLAVLIALFAFEAAFFAISRSETSLQYQFSRS